MNLTEIQDLIKFVAKSGVTEVEIEKKDFKITIKSETQPRRGRGQNDVYEAQLIQPMHIPVQQMPMQQAFAQAPAPAAQAPAAPAAPAAKADDTSRYVEIKSPMIGTFYRRPSPDKDLFVEVGSEVKPGKVVCIIEAMKLFNEIESEISGKIVKVLVDDNMPVEYDQPLFLVDPA
jgi:acetyl-CoA carboxylase biotin carboxyl carrier protein